MYFDNLENIQMPLPIMSLWKYKETIYENKDDFQLELLNDIKESKRHHKETLLSPTVIQYDYVKDFMGKSEVFVIKKFMYTSKTNFEEEVNIVAQNIDFQHYSYIDKFYAISYMKNGKWYGGHYYYDWQGAIDLNGIKYLYDLFQNHGIVFENNPYDEAQKVSIATHNMIKKYFPNSR